MSYEINLRNQSRDSNNYEPQQVVMKAIYKTEGLVEHQYQDNHTAEYRIHPNQLNHVILLMEDFGIYNATQWYTFNNFMQFLQTGRTQIRTKSADLFQLILLLNHFKVYDAIRAICQLQIPVEFRQKSISLYTMVKLFNSDHFYSEYFNKQNIYDKFFKEIVKSCYTVYTNKENDYQSDAQLQILKAYLLMNSLGLNQIFKYLQDLRQTIVMDEMYKVMLAYCAVHPDGVPKDICQTYINNAMKYLNIENIDKYCVDLPQEVNTAFNKFKEVNQYTQSYHMVHGLDCDRSGQVFLAACGHYTCLKCFNQYYLYKTKKFVEVNDRLKGFQHKVRCLSRLTDPSICEKEYKDKDKSYLYELA